MDFIKIIHTADLHLSLPESAPDRYRRQLAKDALIVFFNIIDFSKEYKPDLLLICGDLFSVPNENINFAKLVFEKFFEIPDIDVIITPGNHDFLTSASPYKKIKLPDNVHIFSDFSKLDLKFKNAAVYGAGFNKRFMNKSIFEPALSNDKINICAIHADVTNGTSEYNPLSIHQMEESGYDYIALGHIHSFSGIQNVKNVSYAYPGTPQGQGFDEKGEKGIIFGKVSKNSADLSFKKMSKRMFSELTFDTTPYPLASQAYQEIYKETEKNFGDSFKDNLYKITLTGEYSENNKSYINYIYENLSNNLFYCELIDRTKPDINFLKSMIDETTIKGLFIKKMLKILETSDENEYKTAKKALYKGLELLDNDN